MNNKPARYSRTYVMAVVKVVRKIHTHRNFPMEPVKKKKKKQTHLTNAVGLWFQIENIQ